MITFSTPQLRDTVIYDPDVNTIAIPYPANITPGTYTVGIDGSILTVHALNADFAEGTPDSDLNRRLIALEERCRNMAKNAEEEME